MPVIATRDAKSMGSVVETSLLTSSVRGIRDNLLILTKIETTIKKLLV